MAPGPRRNLLHHLPALVLRRPSVSADPAEMLPGVRGSRLLDRRPPHYRCPAVPGLKASARAILMAPGSSVLPSGSITYQAGTAYCRVLRPTQWPAVAPLFGSQPRRPSCVCSGLEPTAELPGRESAADAFTEVLLTDFAAARQFVLPGPTVSLGYERNYTRATAQCLLQPPQISRRSRQR